jgi:hypothetical protein
MIFLNRPTPKLEGHPLPALRNSLFNIFAATLHVCRSHCLRGLRHRFPAARLLRLWFRIPPGTLKFFHCNCRVLSARGLCDELIARPEESYRLWFVVVCDLETSWMKNPWPTGGCRAKTNKKPSVSKDCSSIRKIRKGHAVLTCDQLLWTSHIKYNLC